MGYLKVGTEDWKNIYYNLIKVVVVKMDEVEEINEKKVLWKIAQYGQYVDCYTQFKRTKPAVPRPQQHQGLDSDSDSEEDIEEIWENYRGPYAPRNLSMEGLESENRLLKEQLEEAKRVLRKGAEINKEVLSFGYGIAERSQDRMINFIGDAEEPVLILRPYL